MSIMPVQAQITCHNYSVKGVINYRFYTPEMLVTLLTSKFQSAKIDAIIGKNWTTWMFYSHITQ